MNQKRKIVPEKDGVFRTLGTRSKRFPTELAGPGHAITYLIEFLQMTLHVSMIDQDALS